MTMLGTRDWRVPPETNTFHAFGDTHVVSGGIGSTSTITNHIGHDLTTGLVPDVPHLFVGDLTDDAASVSDAFFLSWIAGLPNSKYHCIGNHDVNLNNNTRTPAQWAATYGMPDKNYTVDILPGVLRLIVVGFESMADGASFIRLSDATLSYIDAQATAAGALPCAVVCHAPLYNTVLGTVNVDTSSTDSGFWALGGSSVATSDQSTALFALLAAHTNLKMWVSGHTHSRIEQSTIVQGIVAGSHKVAHINCSSTKSPGLSAGGYNAKWTPIRTPYITFNGDSVDVRWRDHYRKQWSHPWPGQVSRRVMSVTGI